MAKTKTPAFAGVLFASVVEEASQFPRSARMLQLPQRLRLDLPDAPPGDRELLADFLPRVVGVHADAEAHAQHALLARRQRRQHARRGLAQVRLDGRVDRQERAPVPRANSLDGNILLSP